MNKFNLNLSFTTFIILLCLFGCGKFNLSPYVDNVDDDQENLGQLLRIVNEEGSVGAQYKVAILSDTHDYYDELAKQVEYINDRKSEIAFVLHTGDATNLGLLVEWEMFEDQINKLEVPIVVVIGNHDLLSNGETIYRKRYIDNLNFSFTHKNTKFVLINNNNWESSGNVPDYDWLEDELSSSTSDNLIILGHVQPDDNDRYDENEIDRMRNLVNTYNVDYFINGHNHNPGEGNFGDAIRLTVGSSAKDKLLILSFDQGNPITHEYISM